MPITVEQATKELRRRDAMRELESRGVSVEPDPVQGPEIGYSYDDPAEYEKQLKETIDIAGELELGIEEAEVNYKNLTEKPDRKPMPVGFSGISAAPEPTKWEKFKNFFTGPGMPPLPPDADRTDKAARALDIAISGPLRTFLKLSKGMTLGAPDLMWAALKRITPDDMWVDEVKDMTLDEAMDWAGGYDPSGFQKAVGELAEFGGRLRTVAPIAQKLGVIGNTPKDLTVLDKMFETAKLFGAAAVGEQAAKFAATKIDPTEAEYGYEGPKAVLRDMAIGAAFSLVHSGVKVAWSKITPTELQRALKLLGLKKGATTDEIRAAARNMARKYHPDKVKGFREEFEKVIKARDAVIKGEPQDIVFRGQKVEYKPKLLPGETVGQQAIRLAEAKKPPAPKGVAKVSPERQAQLDAIKAKGRTKESIRAEEFKTKEQIAEEEAQAARHLASIAKEAKIEAKPTPTAPAEEIVAPAEGEIIPKRVNIEKIPNIEKPVLAYKFGEKILYSEEAGIHAQIQTTEEEHRLIVMAKDDPAGWIYKGKFYTREALPKEALEKAKTELAAKGTKITEKQPWEMTETSKQAADQGFTKADQRLMYLLERGGTQVNISGVPLDDWITHKTPEGLLFQTDRDVADIQKLRKLSEEQVTPTPQPKAQAAAEVAKRKKLRDNPATLVQGNNVDVFLETANKGEVAMAVGRLTDFYRWFRRQDKKIFDAIPPVQELYKQAPEGIKLYSPEHLRMLVGGLQNAIKTLTPQEKTTLLSLPEAITPAAAEKKAVPPKGQAAEGGARLMMGLDPGIDKFVAESVKPAVITAAKGVKALGKFAIGVPKFSADVFLQPSLELERKSPEAYVAVMKAIHTAQDAAKLEFRTMPVEAMDMNIEQVRSYFDKFTKEQQYDFMVSFGGQPGTPDAALMQKEAFDRLPAELQDPKVLKAVREIADKNYQYLVDVVGPNVGLVPDYFYGVFKSRKSVDKFWDHWTSTDKFTKKKTVPSVADAINYGLESGTEIRPRYDNYVDNLMAEYLGIARLDQMQQLKADLLERGSAGTKKPPIKAPKVKKKKGTVIERRAAKLADVYGSAKEALRLQKLEHKVSGVTELSQQQEATIDALNRIIAEEEAAAKTIDIPEGDESLNELREKSEARDPDVKVIHPEDADFYITEDPEIAPADWMGVADPVFRGAWLRPDLARLINNLTSTNKVTRSAVLNPVRKFNNMSRLVTFFASAFHLKTVTLASIADSGWGGPVLHPKQATKAFRNLPSMKRFKQIQQTPEYKRLLRLGTGLGYSFEEDAAKTFESFVEYVNKNNMIGATGKLIETGLRIPLNFQQWQFDIYIPMLKHQANLDEWAKLEAKTGRPATDAELIDIIKATQNFYGEMNERLLGRSGTQTTLSRFAMKAPGFAEGNVRTNIDAAGKWREERGESRGRRARSQIINSLLIKTFIATAGTLFLTGKLPKIPKRKEDFKDLFKIDTGVVDGRGRRVMIDTLDSDKDYLDFWYNMFIIRPDKALYRGFERLGGMKSILAEFVYDGFTSMMGQKIRDWKDEPIFSLSDEPLDKLWKYTVLAIERQKPISASVFQQMRYKEIGRIQSFLGAIAGVRPTFSEYDKREAEFIRLIYDQKENLQLLDIAILGIEKPREAFVKYNKAVDRILDARLLPEGFKELYGPMLYRDVDEYLQNKAETASHWATTDKDKKTTERAVKILKHFEISATEAVELRQQRKRRMQKEAFERKYSKTAEELAKEQIEKKSSIANILRNKRLKERMSEE